MQLYKIFLFSIYAIAIILLPAVSAQTAGKTNIQMVVCLIDSSFEKIPQTTLLNTQLKIVAPGNLAVLSSYVQSAFLRYAKAGEPGNVLGNRVLNYTIEDAKVLYTEYEREGIFGETRLVRVASIQGNYLLSTQQEQLQKFIYFIADTIAINSISGFESSSIPFLSPANPPPHGFETLWEPIAIIATLVVTVYLLFTVRSTN